jgi:mevalonate kinase
MKSVISTAPGKSILFGEHAVVYGFPAIAMAISVYSKCQINEITENKIKVILENYDHIFEADNIQTLRKKISPKYSQISECFQNFQKDFGVQIKNIEIRIVSNLFQSAGLGSSASSSVSLINALNFYYELNLKKEEINSLAYELEKIVHGSPSGIDNTICTFGKAIYFENGKFEYIEIPSEFLFLITYTNIEHNTKEAINRIKHLKEKRPKKTEEWLKQIGGVTKKARVELKKNNILEIGKLMNLNQKYLSNLQVSNNEISEIVNISLKNGAFGSKLTGAGLGGCVITLGKRKILEKISSILEGKGYKSFIAKNDRVGVKCEKV